MGQRPCWGPFYSGIEKALTRIAQATGSTPEGGAWHLQLLEDATLDYRRSTPRPELKSDPGPALPPLSGEEQIAGGVPVHEPAALGEQIGRREAMGRDRFRAR